MILYQLPDADYRSAPGVSFSSMKLYRESPLLYRKAYKDKTLPPRADSEAMRLGRAAHCLILEGQAAFEDRYQVFPAGFDRKSKDRAALWDAAANPLKADELVTIERWALAFEEQPEANKLIGQGSPEVSLTAEHHGSPVKGRLDWYDPARGSVWDLKTVDDLRNFEDQVRRRRRRDMKHWNYYQQLAWYRSLLVLNDPVAVDYSYYLIAVEKVEPYRCGVYQILPILLGLGEEENENTYRDILASENSGHWPGNPVGIQEVDLPAEEKAMLL